MSLEVRPRRLAAVGYVLVRGLRGMGQSLHVQALATLTMAVCMLLLGTTVLLWENARGITRDWGVDVPMTVYVQEGAPAEEVAALSRRLARLPGVDRVVRVSPQDAMDRLIHGLGGQESLLDGIDPETLPESLEVHLADDTPPKVGAALAARLSELDAVDEVAVVGPWAQKVQDLLATLRTLALGVGAMVTLACTAIVWSTIRLGVFARRAEIHILRLVGGTHAFVRGPFVVEGLVQGLVGAALALATLYAGFDMLRPHLEQGLSLVFAAGSLRFFSPAQVAAGLGLGAAIGTLGARAAVARYVEV